MARVATPRPGAPIEGAYEGVRLALLDALLDDPSHAARLQCLDAVKAGLPVRVDGRLLPENVRASAAYVAARHGVGRYGNRFVRPSVMATVYPDGRITYDAETAADWVAEFMPDELVDWRDL